LYGPIPEAEPLVQSIYQSKILLRDSLQILDVGAPAYPLFSAVERGDYDLARTILLQGMNPNLPDSLGVTTLMIAASLDKSYYTELLLEQGADPNQRAENELSPLAISLFKGQEENGRILINGGADVNGGGRFTDSPLYYALIGGYSGTVRFLTEQGCTVTRRDEEGRTGLMYAAFLGDWLSVQALVEGGARPTAIDNQDRGVVWYAMKGYLMTGGENYYTIIDYLIGRGADGTEYASMAGGNRKFRTLLEARWRE
ncbi:MAG: ankyrin repeat domain-containing protein, partial [Spirochaetales bacterium]|nr:ankyrin repeat domain-containing protein [Spirochaetales bacterium]